jgi:3-deoxy-D-manno-octulosonate 8-phosphate phosphatase KdsC-like HAD superfamily phosphatase
MTRLLVLDFDGTMTDAEAEGAPFREGYLQDLAVLTGQPLDLVHDLARQFDAEVARAPDDHGWLFNGRIVAPASVDPYLRIMPVARKIFDRFGAFPGESDRTRLLDGVLYKYNYTKTKTAFRTGAAEALVALAGTETYVVTNSHTDAVARKLHDLGAEWLVPRVHGRAQKYVIDDAFALVPESLALPGLARPVLLRRKAYFDALDALRTAVGAAWSEVAVCGDIFELDLSLPLALGATVGLVVNDFTPAYERAFVEAHPRGKIVTALSQLPAFFGR